MRTARLLRLSVVLLAATLASCDAETGVTNPPEILGPSFGTFHAPQGPDAQRIEALIIALYPGPGLEVAALERWANVQRQLERGRTPAAQSQMRALAAQVTDFAAAGTLEVPADPLLPETLALAVAELVTRLYVFVGLEVSDALEAFPDDLPDDFGIGYVDPEEGGTIVTTNSWAAVVAGPGATEEGVFITIELLDEVTCSLADPLTQALGCWNIERYPEGVFTQDVKVEICVADNPVMTDEEWDLLLVHQKEDDGTVSVLPWAEPTTVDCTDFAVGGPEQAAYAGPVQSLLAYAGNRVADFFLPEPLGAAMMADRPPRGLGGTSGAFSDFFGAVPEGAQPNLVSWWRADGNYLDLYGGNHGAPMGDVAFGTPAISGQAFQFDGDGDAVLVTPLSEEVRNLQDLTLATWVYLDPSSPADQIQRFVSLGDGKAVLRQEGGEGHNRALHFYMMFEPVPTLRHIWVPNAFQTGCFHFFAGTWDGDVMRAYLDGALRGSSFVSGGTVAVGSDWAKLGASGGPFDPVEVLNGALDEVMIFDRALSAEELQAIYDAGGTAKCVPSAGYQVSGIVRYSSTPLPGVRVTLYPTSDPSSVVETVTDGTGHYAFTNVFPGDYTVRVYGDGYEDPANPGEYPFLGWTGRTLTVVDDDVVMDRDLPKNIHLTSPSFGAFVAPDGLTLEWEANAEADNDGGYSIQINETDNWWPTVEVGYSTSASYAVRTALTPGTKYTWQVGAHDAHGRWVGSTEWAFEYNVDGTFIDFETLGETPVSELDTPIDITDQYSLLGLVVSFQRPPGEDPVEASLCDALLTAKEGEVEDNHSLTAHASGDPCAGWQTGEMTMTFPAQPTFVRFRVRGPDGLFYITAFDGSDNDITGTVEIADVSTYDPPARSNTWREETWIVRSPTGISRVVVNHAPRILMVDNLAIYP